MRRWLITFFLSFAIPATFAQPQQKTHGNASPIVNLNGQNSSFLYAGTLQVNNGPGIYALLDALDRTNDKELKHVRDLIIKGKIFEARRILNSFYAKEQNSRRKFALAKFAEAQMLLLEEEPRKAAEAMSAALSLDPDNCQYRAVSAFSNLAVGRLGDTEVLLADESAAANCYTNGSPTDIALLRLARVQLASELRNEAEARRQMNFAWTAIRSIKASQPRDWLGARCGFYDTASGYWLSSYESLWPDAEAYCRAEIASGEKDSSQPSAAVLEFFKPHATPREKIIAGARIFSKYADFDDAEFPGADLLRRKALFAQIKSEYGLRLLWEGGDPVASGKAYAEAYELMVPLIGSGRPSIITNFAQLAIRIEHLESISTTRVFANSNDRIKVDLGQALLAIRSRGSPGSCDAMARIRGAGYKILSSDQSDSLYVRQVQCLEQSTQANTYTDLKIRDSWIGDSTSPTEEQLNLKIASRKKLFGFPETPGLHSKQAFDLMILAELYWQNSTKPSAEVSAKHAQLISEAANEALIDPSSISRMVMTRIIFAFHNDVQATRMLEHLLSEPGQPHIDGDRLGECQQQRFRLEELYAAAQFSGIHKNVDKKAEALKKLAGLRMKGNLCTDIPPEKELSPTIHVEVVSAILRQLALIDEIDNLKRDGEENSKLRSSTAGTECLATFAKNGLFPIPLCSLDLPKPAKT